MSKLIDFCLKITDGEHGSVLDDNNGEYFLLSNKNIINGHVNIDNNDRKINSADFIRINKRINLEKDDVLLSTVGTIGKIAIVENNINYVVQRSVGVIKTNKKKLNPYYLKYQLLLPEFQKRMNYLSKGAVQKCLFIGDLENLEVNVPNLNIQNSIVMVLNSIDNKIDNNNQIIKKSYEICLNIYNYWFNLLKNSNGNYKIKYNEVLKRNIPENWEVLKVKDCIQHINTGLNPRDNFKLGSGNIKYVTVKNLTSDGNIDFSGCDFVDEKAREIIHNRSDVSKDDILFASIAPLGRCVIVKENPKNWDINESVFCIRPNFDKVSSEYLYMYFMSEYFIKKAEHSSTGSIFSGIRINTLEDMPILVPDKKTMELFTNKVTDLFMMKYNKEKENEKLISLRDFLLPLLMNGQIKLN